MRTLTQRQFLELRAELLGMPFMADLFFEEMGIEDLLEIPRNRYHEALSIVTKFRELNCELADFKKRSVQSRSRFSGRDMTRRM